MMKHIKLKICCFGCLSKLKLMYESNPSENTKLQVAPSPLSPRKRGIATLSLVSVFIMFSSHGKYFNMGGIVLSLLAHFEEGRVR
jgi:hypothetical protein